MVEVVVVRMNLESEICRFDCGSRETKCLAFDAKTFPSRNLFSGREDCEFLYQILLMAVLLPYAARSRSRCYGE